MLVRVVRPLCVGGIRKEVGELVDLRPPVAAEAISTGRAERIPESESAPVGPMTTDSAPELVGKKRKQKEQTDAV